MSEGRGGNKDDSSSLSESLSRGKVGGPVLRWEQPRVGGGTELLDVLSLKSEAGAGGTWVRGGGQESEDGEGMIKKDGLTGWRGRAEGMAWAARRLGRRASHHPVSPG